VIDVGDYPNISRAERSPIDQGRSAFRIWSFSLAILRISATVLNLGIFRT
jgi:hypothetical protein